MNEPLVWHTEQRKINDLIPWNKNPRRMTDVQASNLRTSLEHLNLMSIPVIDMDDMIISGHQRMKTMQVLGRGEEIIDVRVPNRKLTQSEFEEANLRENKNLGEWDNELLAEMDAILLKDVGFSDEELDEILKNDGFDDGGEGGNGDPDEVPDPPAEPKSKLGDLFQIGRHRLLCGDSTKREDVERLMGGEKAELCFTSPPYGQQRDYTEDSDCSDWDSLICGVFKNIPISDNGQILVNLGLIHRECEWVPYWNNWIDFMRVQQWRRFGLYVWDQGAGLPGDWNGRFAPSFELIFHFNKKPLKPNKFIETKEESRKAKGKNGTVGFNKEGGSKQCCSPDKIGQDYKIPDSVIRINRHSMDGKLHPATFPVALAEYIINSFPGNIYEPFCGSGSTIIASENLNRKCFAMEIAPAYIDIIISRWETFTGQQAVKL